MKKLDYFLAIVINEIAWMGTPSNPADEWIELYNPSSYEVNISSYRIELAKEEKFYTILITSGTIPAQGFFIVAGSWDVFSNLKIDFCYNCKAPKLNNSGVNLSLINSENEVIDFIECFPAGWFAGDNLSRATMERIFFAQPGNVPSNWQTSLIKNSETKDIQGFSICGTPRAANSSPNNEYLELEVKDYLEVLHSPFSPYSGAYYPESMIIYEIPSGAKGWLRIYDVKGQLVKILKENINSGKGSVCWKGDDENGDLVSIGIYIVVLQIEKEGNEIRKAKTVIVGEKL